MSQIRFGELIVSMMIRFFHRQNSMRFRKYTNVSNIIDLGDVLSTGTVFVLKIWLTIRLSTHHLWVLQSAEFNIAKDAALLSAKITLP